MKQAIIKYEHYIFDFDGVMADSRQIAAQEFNRLATTRFLSLPQIKNQEDLALVFSGPLRTSLRRFGLSDEESALFFDLHSEAMRDRCNAIDPFDEILQLIAARVPRRCSIVTSCYSDAVKIILAKSHYYYDGLFHCISGREARQTKTQKINEILRQISLPPTDALHVADMVSDILYSQQVPIHICAVGWGYHPPQYLNVFAPDYLVTTPQELSHLLASMND